MDEEIDNITYTDISFFIFPLFPFSPFCPSYYTESMDVMRTELLKFQSMNSEKNENIITVKDGNIENDDAINYEINEINIEQEMEDMQPGKENKEGMEEKEKNEDGNSKGENGNNKKEEEREEKREDDDDNDRNNNINSLNNISNDSTNNDDNNESYQNSNTNDTEINSPENENKITKTKTPSTTQLILTNIAIAKNKKVYKYLLQDGIKNDSKNGSINSDVSIPNITQSLYDDILSTKKQITLLNLEYNITDSKYCIADRIDGSNNIDSNDNDFNAIFKSLNINNEKNDENSNENSSDDIFTIASGDYFNFKHSSLNNLNVNEKRLYDNYSNKYRMQSYENNLDANTDRNNNRNNNYYNNSNNNKKDNGGSKSKYTDYTTATDNPFFSHNGNDSQSSSSNYNSSSNSRFNPSYTSYSAYSPFPQLPHPSSTYSSSFSSHLYPSSSSIVYLNYISSLPPSHTLNTYSSSHSNHHSYNTNNTNHTTNTNTGTTIKLRSAANYNHDSTKITLFPTNHNCNGFISDKIKRKQEYLARLTET